MLSVFITMREGMSLTPCATAKSKRVLVSVMAFWYLWILFEMFFSKIESSIRSRNALCVSIAPPPVRLEYSNNKP